MTYQPSQQLLDNYAAILINCALHAGQGIRPGEVALLSVSESARPMLDALRRAVLKAGAHAIVQYNPDEFNREFFELASDDQLAFFPGLYLKGLVDQVDHMVFLRSDANPRELEGIPPKKIMTRQETLKPYLKWREEKEDAGRFFWTLGAYPTQAMADEAKMSLDDYWQELIKACYLDAEDPVAAWRGILGEIDRVKDTLNNLDIRKVRIEAPDTDITIGIGPHRQWLGGSGHNIPSFEVFISPDANDVNGRIQFTEPLYVYGNILENVYLEFVDGRVTKATATKGQDVLKEMIAVKNADRVGELSLTDSRLSRITRFMANTLFDENVGGPNGNTHLALGRAYKDSYTDDLSQVTEEQWQQLGFNDSVVHTDIVATSPRKVTATLPTGHQKTIYQSGQFTI